MDLMVETWLATKDQHSLIAAAKRGGALRREEFTDLSGQQINNLSVERIQRQETPTW